MITLNTCTRDDALVVRYACALARCAAGSGEPKAIEPGCSQAAEPTYMKSEER